MTRLLLINPTGGHCKLIFQKAKIVLIGQPAFIPSVRSFLLGFTMNGINKISNLVYAPIWDYRQKLAVENVNY